MPHNVTVAGRTPTSVVLMTDGPRRTGGMPVTSWMLKYEEVHGHAHKTFFFSKGETHAQKHDANTNNSNKQHRVWWPAGQLPADIFV